MTTTMGQLVWYELMTTDPAAAIAFYGEVIGWRVQPYQGEKGDYPMLVGSFGPLGGVTELPEQARQMGAGPHWTAHVTVKDVDATAAQVRDLGGKVHVGPFDIPKIGRWALIAAPEGATICVFTPLEPMPAHDRKKHGEFCWAELMTRDHKAAFDFFHAVCGWEHLADYDMGPLGNYLLYGLQGTQLGGMFDMPKDVAMPPAFLYYVQVDDLDSAYRRAQALGAKVQHEPVVVPSGARMAQLRDPQGAAFALHEEPKKG